MHEFLTQRVGFFYRGSRHFLSPFTDRKARGKPKGEFTALNDNYRGNGKTCGKNMYKFSISQDLIVVVVVGPVVLLQFTSDSSDYFFFYFLLFCTEKKRQHSNNSDDII